MNNMENIVTIGGKKYCKVKTNGKQVCQGCAFCVSPNNSIVSQYNCSIDRYNEHCLDCINDDIIFVELSRIESSYSINHSYHYERVYIPLKNGTTITRYFIYSKTGNVTLFVGVETNEDVAKWICENR